MARTAEPMRTKNVWKHWARTVVKHRGQGHKIRVQLIPDCDGDLEIYCVFCGLTLLMGSPAIVNELAELLVDGGFEVTKLNNPQCSIRLH